MSEKEDSVVGGRYAKIALGLLVIVYIFNFVDRQIISILAEDIKAVRDTKISFYILRED
jgi:hypothetical protein